MSTSKLPHSNSKGIIPQLNSWVSSYTRENIPLKETVEQLLNSMYSAWKCKY